MSKKMKNFEEIVEIISIAIAREQNSVKYYKKAYDKATTENARRLFSLLVEQEKGHEAKLRAQLHEIKSEIGLVRLKLKK